MKMKMLGGINGWSIFIDNKTIDNKTIDNKTIDNSIRTLVISREKNLTIFAF